MGNDYTSFLRKVPLFNELPENDLEAICSSVREVRLQPGEMLFFEGEQGTEAYVIVDGKVEIWKKVNNQKVQLSIRQPGEVIGEISLIEMRTRTASGQAITETLLISIGQEQINYLLKNPSSARAMLHTVILRLQSTEASLWQSERLAHLGTFTAGIAHEINNPASAVLRGTEQLKNNQLRRQDFSYDLRTELARLGREGDYQLLRVKLQDRINQALRLTLGERMDREANLEVWINDLNLDDAWELAPQMVDIGFDVPSLSALVSQYPHELAPVLIRWMASEVEVNNLMEEVHQGAAHISSIIKALKSYVYLDQAPNQEIDVHDGLENTLVILRHKLKQGVTVIREYDRSLPVIAAYGSELNQVWTNLIDNAIDATDGKGNLTLRTSKKENCVVVEIEDNGPGIPPEIQEKLFYPFFTTKPVGKGTGLGLSISFQIVQKHGGTIRVHSQPGRTVFEVRLPVNDMNK